MASAVRNAIQDAVQDAIQDRDQRPAAESWWTAPLRRAARALSLWHLCSLDAPTVAVVWASALASSAGIRLEPPELAVLALGTWIVYVLDRLLDGMVRTERRRLQARHWFHRRHRRLLLALSSVAAVALGCLCSALPWELVRFYLILGVPVAAYALCVHQNLLGDLHGSAHARGSGDLGSRKEAAVALLFTTAVAAPAYDRAPAHLRPSLLFTAVLLVMLCFFNCILISHAEATARRTAFASRQERSLRWGGLTLAGLAAAGCCASLRAGATETTSARAAVMASCLLLLGLLRMQRTHANPRPLRVLADLALLTPVLFLLVHAW